VHKVNAGSKASQTFTGECKRLWVAIDANQSQVRKPIKESFAVAAKAECAVHHDWVFTGESFGQDFNRALKKHWFVKFRDVLGHLFSGDPCF
jgi:hypothetical protein